MCSYISQELEECQSQDSVMYLIHCLKDAVALSLEDFQKMEGRVASNNEMIFEIICSVSESDIVKFNPLYHGAKEDEGKDGDSINSYSQVGQFFPEHPTLDPVYDQIEPVKFQKHQTYDDDDDNFDDIDKILSEY